MERVKKYLPHILLLFLSLFTILVWFFLYKTKNNDSYLKVVFLDVGQGDAIYIEAPNGKQMLIDGGPDAKLLSSLSQVMPFADRSIDVVLATHPDMDHIGGFPALIDSYNVGNIIENGANSDSEVYQMLEQKISKNKIKKIIAHKGMKILLDENRNIYFDILFPDRDILSLESNDGSIVGKLVYGDRSFMLTGDSSLYAENQIEWSENINTLHSDILKLGHHGAKTASGMLWLERVNPEVAIISAGKKNRYGHPNKEVLDRLTELKIPYISTIDKGSIIFETDGIVLKTVTK